MDPISPFISIPPVGSATSQGQGQQSQPGTLPLGQLVKALVVEAKTSGQFTLDVGGSRLTAQSQSPLSVGQNLQLQVVNTTPQIELKIVSDTLNQFIGKSLTLLGKNIDISTLFQNISQTTPPLLESLSPTSRSVIESFFTLQQTDIGNKEGGTVIKQLLEGVGLHLENHLTRGDKNSAAATLKAALLEIAHTFKDAEGIVNATNKALTTIELFQLTQLNSNNDSFLIFPLPLPFLESGYLKVDKDSANRTSADPEEFRFSLHITMSDLGNINIDFSKTKNDLFIRFRAESTEKMEFIQQFASELTDGISNIPHISISFSPDATDPITDLVKQIVPDGQSMLDTKA